MKSYILAIKAVLAEINVKVNENKCLLSSLTGARRLTNDSVRIRLPIQKDLLNLLLRITKDFFNGNGQPYLASLYATLFSTAYYGLFRIGKIASSEHSVKVCNMHLGENKRKYYQIKLNSLTHVLIFNYFWDYSILWVSEFNFI